MLGEAARDVRLVYYELFTSYLKGRTYSLSDNDFSFKMVLNNCTEIDMNWYIDLFQTEAEE